VATKNELVVVPTVASLSSDIRKLTTLLAALSDSLREAIIAGKALIALKAQLKKENIRCYGKTTLAFELGLAIRNAQNYMHLAKHEAT